MLAVTRLPDPSLATGCALTHLPRVPLDWDRAVEQHEAYRAALAAAGCDVRVLPALEGSPDAVFVEDVAVHLPWPGGGAGWTVLCRPALPARASETLAMRADLEALGLLATIHPPVALGLLATIQPPVAFGPLATIHPPVALGLLATIQPPGHLEGGDVLRIGRRIFVGLSGRTDDEGFRQLAELARRLDFEVIPVPVGSALHLKTACTALDGETLLLNPEWVRRDHFPGMRIVDVDPGEPFAGNVLRVGHALVTSASWPRTRERLARHGFEPTVVPLSEFEKAEAGASCLSVLVP